MDNGDTELYATLLRLRSRYEEDNMTLLIAFFSFIAGGMFGFLVAAVLIMSDNDM